MWTHFCSSVLGTQSFLVKCSLLFLQVGNCHNEKLGNAYQDYYGTNIVMEMRQNGQHDIIQYLENKGEGFIDRYVTLFNHNIK